MKVLLKIKTYFKYSIAALIFVACPVSFAFTDSNQALSSPAPAPSSLEFAMTGRWNQGPVFASATSDNHMYFGSSGTVRVVKVTKDSSGNAVGWQEISSIATKGVVRDMLIEGDYLYIADGSGWMRIIDVSNPKEPKHSAAVKLNSEIKSINFENNKVYLAGGWGGVHVVDVKKKNAPVLLRSFDSIGYALDVVVIDKVGYIAAGQNGFKIVDFSNPKEPKLLAEQPISGRAAGIDSNGKYVYIVNMDDVEPSLSIFDVSKKQAPQRIAIEPLAYGAERVRLEGDFVYVAGVANDAGLIIIDVSKPSKPKKLGSWWDSTCSESVTIDNQIAYLAHGDQGLEILDLRDPNKPFVTEHFSAAGHVRGIDSQEKLAYLANGYRGLKIVEVLEDGTTETLSELKTYRALDVDVVGDFAHIADDWAGYKLINVTNPESPVLVSKLDTPGYAEDLFVAGDYVYIADGEGGLRILDLSTPSSPKEISSISVDGYAYEVFVEDSYAYLAAGKAGLLVVDVSNPEKPEVVNTFKPEEKSFEARGISVKGNKALLAAGYRGLRILDISEPKSLVEVSVLPTKRKATDVSLINDRAYLIDSNIVHLVDLSNPQKPKSLAKRDLPSSATKIHVSSDNVYIAGMESGLLIFNL